MALARYSRHKNTAQLCEQSCSQQERNGISQISNNDYDSVQSRQSDAHTYDDLRLNVTVNSAEANTPERTEDATPRGSTEDATPRRSPPYRVDRHPWKILILALVGMFLFSTLSSVITGLLVHNMTQATLEKPKTSENERFPQDYNKGSDSISNNYNDTHLTDMDRRMDLMAKLWHKMNQNQSEMLDQVEDVDRKQGEMEHAVQLIQANFSDILGHVAGIKRQQDETVTVLQKMKANQSDILGHVADITRQQDETVNMLQKMEANQSDTLDNIADIFLRLDEMDSVLQQLQEKINYSVPVSTACMKCPDGWKLFESSCYLLSDEYGNFTDAVKYCENRNAYLVEIDSAAENDFLEDYITNTSSNVRFACWIGLTDEEAEGVWKRHHSGDTPQFTNWRPGEPNNNDDGPGEDCTTFDRSWDFQWNDLTCAYRTTYACEMRSTNCPNLVG